MTTPHVKEIGNLPSAHPCPEAEAGSLVLREVTRPVVAPEEVGSPAVKRAIEANQLLAA